ncbi:MAG TPA: ChbG/HpnK family deacetylase [Hyphomicrobiaceae bacterium]|nr:ChbG/HpnK family deacetylase [Hyphomicrobiaceae bacterium]
MLILSADDYALSPGVARAVGELSAARRLSATSVLVTTAHWPALAPRLYVHRGHLAIGLHFNLTLGRPLGPMPKLAPSGELPPIGKLIAGALVGLPDLTEIKDEFERQLDHFERGLPFAPDQVDGHQHIHVLPGIREVVLETLARRYPRLPPLVRDPADRWQAIAARRTARGKAALVATLALGFAAAARRHGLPTNAGFSGFSSFDVRVPYLDELNDALTALGPRPIVMCHPGHVDQAPDAADAVAARRRMEYDVLMGDRALPQRIWRPARSPGGPPVDWSQMTF